MARTSTQITAPAELIEVAPAAHQQLAELQNAATQQAAALHQLAHSLGYQGSLTVGGLEDEIRFYQRRSVEALLECGKRLLLLKEITPHGEFKERVEELGFAERTAQRFMQAAAKVAKSATVAVLAGQVKNQKAFLEIVTHDDDADLERLAELDDIDRMSASQLRAALREIKEETKAKDQLLEDKNKRIDKLHAAQQRIQSAPPDEVLADLRHEATTIATETEGMVLGRLRAALEALQSHGREHADSASAHHAFMVGLVDQVQRQLDGLRDMFCLPVRVTATAEWQQWADAQDAQDAQARQAGSDLPGADAPAH